MKQLPSYSDVEQAMRLLEVAPSASESHGILCGRLLSGCSFLDWFKELQAEIPDHNDVTKVEQMQLLKALFDVTHELMQSNDMKLQLLLPEDRHSMSTQVQALSDWCQGFIFALGLTSANKQLEADPQSLELLVDLLEIAQIKAEIEPADEQAEQHLLELSEYVRMGVIYLQDTLNPIRAEPRLH